MVTHLSPFLDCVFLPAGQASWHLLPPPPEAAAYACGSCSDSCTRTYAQPLALLDGCTGAALPSSTSPQSSGTGSGILPSHKVGWGNRGQAAGI